MVRKKETCFLLINVNSEPPDVAAFEAKNDRMCVKNRPATGINEDDPLFHPFEGGGVNEVACACKQGHVEGENIGFPKNLLLAYITGDPSNGGVWHGVVGEDQATETAEIVNHLVTDGTRPKHPDGFLFEFESLETLELKVIVPHALPGSGNMTGKGEHQAQGKLRDGMRRVGGYESYGDSEFSCSGNIDVVVASAESGHDPRASAGEDLQGGPV